MLPESSEQRVPLVCPDEGGRSPISFAYNGAHATWNTRSMSGLRLGPSAIRPLWALGIEDSWPWPSKVTFALEAGHISHSKHAKTCKVASPSINAEPNNGGLQTALSGLE